MKLTPKRGLRRYQPAANGQPGTLEPVHGPLKIEGRVLLLVHGTFSKSDMFVEEFAAAALKPTDNFLDRAAAKKYQAILAFDHPTLSVSPWINALDLEGALSGVTGPIDVICHSRGGLVVAWWLRNAKRSVDDVIFVGSPLEGTSLAAPANLRSALQFLAGTFKALEATSAGLTTILPFMAASDRPRQGLRRYPSTRRQHATGGCRGRGCSRSRRAVTRQQQRRTPLSASPRLGLDAGVPCRLVELRTRRHRCPLVGGLEAFCQPKDESVGISARRV